MVSGEMTELLSKQRGQVLPSEALIRKYMWAAEPPTKKTGGMINADEENTNIELRHRNLFRQFGFTPVDSVPITKQCPDFATHAVIQGANVDFTRIVCGVSRRRGLTKRARFAFVCALCLAWGKPDFDAAVCTKLVDFFNVSKGDTIDTLSDQCLAFIKKYRPKPGQQQNQPEPSGSHPIQGMPVSMTYIMFT